MRVVKTKESQQLEDLTKRVTCLEKGHDWPLNMEIHYAPNPGRMPNRWVASRACRRCGAMYTKTLPENWQNPFNAK